MSSGASALTVAGLRQRWSDAGAAWRPVWSKPAALRAIRATLVMPTLFAFCDQVIGNLQIATFVAFGSFATLVLSSFAGTPLMKLRAHLALALAGSVLLTIGTAVSSSTVVAAIVTVPVTFVVFFSGVAGPNAASGVTGALLAYVLPAASSGTMGMVPDRLVGWWLASVAGTAAVLALPTPAAGNQLREGVARLSSTLADGIDAALRGAAGEDTIRSWLAAKGELLSQFNATPFRPIGLARGGQALSNAIELLEWCTAVLVDGVRERGDLRQAPEVLRDLLAASADALRDSGALFAGGERPPDLERLDGCRRRSLAWMRDVRPGTPEFLDHARLSFHADALAMTVLAIGADALIAAGLVGDEWINEARLRWAAAQPDARPWAVERRLAVATRYAGVAARHASVRSVWFVNSLRGALALAVAVAVADLTSVQHGFWVVLGTLSVLRTNAAATGSTALRALAGTAFGFVVGGALLVAIGSGSAALWVALPVAVFVASYAPGTAPFAVGQAAFTVTIAVLFNLLLPVGWKVGEVRIEDVAIGCAVSVLVGTLFWPRGVAPLVGDDLADAYRAGAAYLREAVAWVCGARAEEPIGSATAVTAGMRLDEALRAFLAEQGTKHIGRRELWRLVGGTLRLRLTAHAIAGLPRECTAESEATRDGLVHRAESLDAWYAQLAELMGRPRGRAVGALTPPILGAADGGTALESRRAVWLGEHLDHLAEHLGDLIEPATHVAEIRRRPWWR